MKKNIFFLLTLLTTSILHAQSILLEKPVKYEVRAAWITIFHNIDWPKTRISNDSTQEECREAQKQELCTMLDQLQRAGINTVLFQTRVGACTAYPSDIEPWHRSFTGHDGGNPGYDPLAFAVEECHKRGMELQCWISAIPVGSYNGMGARRLRERGFPMRRFAPGSYLDPSYEKVPDYLAELCLEMTTRYDIDGIHLDFIRYSEEWPRAASQEEANNRRTNITRIVRKIHDVVKAAKPWVKMSCSPLGKYADLQRQSAGHWTARNRVYQEAQEWVKEGLMDQLYPMMYFQGKNFYPFAADWMENSCGRTIVAGLGTYFLSPWSRPRWNGEEVSRQMMVTRWLGMGTAHFSAGNLLQNHGRIFDTAANVYSPWPALVPPMSWMKAQAMNAPTEVALQGNVLQWKGNAPYYNVYASDSHPVDVSDTRNLIAIRYSGTSLNVSDRHRNVPHKYFAVTAMDRYGYESLPVQSHEQFEHELLMKNNAEMLQLPEEASKTARYDILTLTGQAISTRLAAHDGQVALWGVPPGAYLLYTSAGRNTRRAYVGSFTIKTHDQTQ